MTGAERARLEQVLGEEVPGRRRDAEESEARARVARLAGGAVAGLGVVAWFAGAGLLSLAGIVPGTLLVSGGEMLTIVARRDRREADRAARDVEADLAAGVVDALELEVRHAAVLIGDDAWLLDVGDGTLALVRDVRPGAKVTIARAPTSGREHASAEGEVPIASFRVDHGRLSLPHPLEGSVEGLDPRIVLFRGEWSDAEGALARFEDPRNPWSEVG